MSKKRQRSGANTIESTDLNALQTFFNEDSPIRPETRSRKKRRLLENQGVSKILWRIRTFFFFESEQNKKKKASG